jgi:hypothetical protein
MEDVIFDTDQGEQIVTLLKDYAIWLSSQRSPRGPASAHPRVQPQPRGWVASPVPARQSGPTRALPAEPGLSALRPSPHRPAS